VVQTSVKGRDEPVMSSDHGCSLCSASSDDCVNDDEGDTCRVTATSSSGFRGWHGSDACKRCSSFSSADCRLRHIRQYWRHQLCDTVARVPLELEQFNFLQRAQCSHCKRCISYGNSVCLSVRLSVCLSVCPSVTRRYCVKTTARITV